MSCSEITHEEKVIINDIKEKGKCIKGHQMELKKAFFDDYSCFICKCKIKEGAIHYLCYSCLPEDVSGYLIHGVRQPPGAKSIQFQY